MQVKGEYGWPRMWKELVARGLRVGKERVRKLMAQHGIRARQERKYIDLKLESRSAGREEPSVVMDRALTLRVASDALRSLLRELGLKPQRERSGARPSELRHAFVAPIDCLG
jgi:transposase InsO family protein